MAAPCRGYTSLCLSRVSWEPFKLPGSHCTHQLHSQMSMVVRGRFAYVPVLLGPREDTSVFGVERSHFALIAAPWSGDSRDHDSKAQTHRRSHVPVISDAAGLCSAPRGGFLGQQPCIQPAPGPPCPSLALTELLTAALKWGLNSSHRAETAGSHFCKARYSF